MNADTLILLLAGIFGLLVGSFSNVLIWRLPRRENIAFPPSHCPKCDHQLHAIDLVPVFSWLSLGGKCRYCKAPINPRYPIVEAVTGVAYTAIAALYPVSAYGIAPLGLMFLFTILLAGSLIDLAVFELPDELTLVGVALGLLFAFLHKGVGVLPSLPEALNGALMGAGIIVLISLLGSWVMRRFRERQHPEFPIGYQQISLGLLVGAWFGPLAALIAAAAAMLVNMGAKKVVRIPEIITLGGFFLSLLLSSSGLGPNLIALLQNGLAGAGAASLLCGVYWWWANVRNKDSDAAEDDTPGDPVAMGFGDVKLMAAIGAFLGWQAVLVALVVSVFAGAIIGLVMLAMKKGNKIPFGPYLAIGAVVALFWGEPIIQWYRGMMGL